MAQTQNFWENDPVAQPQQQPQAQGGQGALRMVVSPQPGIPQGYQQTPSGLTPIHGGPADPANQPPAGYRYKADGTLEAIPGGPADPDRNATGASDDPAIRAQAQALVEGRIPYPTSRAATDPHWQQIIATAFAIDPNFDETSHARRRQAVMQFTGNGSAAQRIGSAERLARHLSDLSRASDQLSGPDTGFSPLNTLAATVGQAFEPTPASTYDTAVGQVANELERYFRGVGGSQADIERLISNLGRHQSLDQRRAAIREVISLIGGGIQPLQQQYNDAFTPGSPRPHITWLSPHAQQIYSNLGGIDFGIPGMDQPPQGGGPQQPGGGGGSGGNGNGGNGGGMTAADVPRPEGDLGLSGNTDSHLVPFTPQQVADYVNAIRAHPAGQLTPDQFREEFQRTLGRPATGNVDRAVQFYNRTGDVPTNFQYDDHTQQERDAIAAAVAAARGGDPNDPGFSDALDRALAANIPVFGPVASEIGNVSGPNAGQAYTRGMERGVSFGFNDEIRAAIGAALGNGSYGSNVDAERAINNFDDTNHPWASLGGQASGALATAPLFEGRGASLLEAPGLAARMRSGANIGARVGALTGVGNGEGFGDRLVGGLRGGIEGAAFGGAMPAVGAMGRAVGRLARGGYRTVLGQNPGAANRIISQAIAADGNTPADVAAQMTDAQANGVPAMLADTGDNVRGQLAASARAPGPARTLARDALDARQAGMAERITGAIERDLGPIANPHEVADHLMTQARDTAAPLYDEAYALPGADAFFQRVRGLFDRPSMQRALQGARRIALEEGRDPTTLGFDINDAGEVTLTRVPSWQTMDYVKRGMDDVVQGARDSITGRLDTEGRAVNNTLQSFLKAFDDANPAYARARAAYGGPVRGIDAMNEGRAALNMSGDDIEAAMRGMTPFERDMFRLGARRAMAELASSRGDTANIVTALAGTGKKRAMLARLFGDRNQFDRFVQTLGHEREAFRTYQTARLGSPTAPNLQDDQALRDAVTEGGTDLLLNGGTGVPSAVVRFLTRMGRRNVDNKTQQEIAALLSETDPARLNELASELRQEQTRQAVIAKRQARRARVGAVVAGQRAGRQRN